MPKAYSYIRMSTETQLKGDSLRRQIAKSENFAREHGLELDGSFNLQDIGFSAFDGSNVEKGQLGKFLAAVRQGRVEKGSILIVESLDRLTRQRVRPALRIFLDLLDHGISIATMIDKRIFRPDDVDHNDLMYSLGSLTRSYDESLTKSERVAEAWNEKRKRISSEILTKRCVAWVRAREDRSGFDLLPDRVAVVRRIFDEATDKGMGADMIARRLNRDKTPTFGRSNGWQKSYILKILTNRAVLGEFQPRTRGVFRGQSECEVVKNYYPPIIEDALFYRAQSALARRRQVGGGRKGDRVANLFSGIVYCGTCLGRMHYINKGKKGGRILICDAARRGLGCHKVSWAYEEFEQTFLTFVTNIDIKAFFNESRIDEELRETHRALEALDGKLLITTQKRDRVLKLIVGDEPTDYLASRFRELDSEVAQLAEERDITKRKFEETLHAHRTSADSKTDVLDLIAKVQCDGSDEIVATRAAIASRLRHLIKEILMFPAGNMCSAEQLREILCRDDVDEFLQDKPSKGERVVMVDFNDGTFTMIKPDEFNAGLADYVVTDKEWMQS